MHIGNTRSTMAIFIYANQCANFNTKSSFKTCQKFYVIVIWQCTIQVVSQMTEGENNGLQNWCKNKHFSAIILWHTN